MIEPAHPHLRVTWQCELLVLAPASSSSQPMPESEEKLRLMRWLAEQETHTPFDGMKKMTGVLRGLGSEVNHKRGARLFRLMGLEAISPKPRLSQPGEHAQRYPYVLRGMRSERVNQVWRTDIPSIRLKGGWVSLGAILDWWSRSVLAWRTSRTLETGWCLEAREQAFQQARPEMFNTDQGSQCPSIVGISNTCTGV